MVIERTELVRLLEEALFLMPTERGDIAEFRIPGVRGRITPISHPMVNLVRSVPRAGGAIQCRHHPRSRGALPI